MRDLFQVVFELKKKEMDEAKQLMNKENRVRLKPTKLLVQACH